MKRGHVQVLRVLSHRLQNVNRLEAYRLEQRARQVGLRGELREPHAHATRVRPPPRGEQAGERGHEVHAAHVGHGRCQRLHVRGGFYDAQVIPQPLDPSARDRHAAFQRVHRLGVLTQPPRHRGQQPVRGFHLFIAGVEEHEATRPVGVFSAADVAALTQRSRVLIPEAPRELNPAQRTLREHPVLLRARHDGRE